MEIKGKIIQVLPPQGGISKSGNHWKKQEYILLTPEDQPSKVKFDLFGDLVDKFPLTVGDIVTIDINIESREYNGRWYTDVHAYHVALNKRTEPCQTN
jgi:hypothetical protein